MAGYALALGAGSDAPEKAVEEVSPPQSGEVLVVYLGVQGLGNGGDGWQPVLVEGELAFSTSLYQTSYVLAASGSSAVGLASSILLAWWTARFSWENREKSVLATRGAASISMPAGQCHIMRPVA